MPNNFDKFIYFTRNAAVRAPAVLVCQVCVEQTMKDLSILGRRFGLVGEFEKSFGQQANASPPLPPPPHTINSKSRT